ncbi:MAG: hypothetical protein HZC40_11025, partial [Chloroflexi bacterium]|nr:hypothetical protein [Chloroflexota bacterium]
GASGATHFIRATTNDYLYGALFGVTIVVLLLIPQVKERLFHAPVASAQTQAALRPSTV